jgi:hypothetical protein
MMNPASQIALLGKSTARQLQFGFQTAGWIVVVQPFHVVA